MNSRLLLDTCAIIWIAKNAPLADPAIAAMDAAFDANRPVLVSQITAWELGLLSSRGRLPSARPPYAFFQRFLDRPGIRVEVLTAAVLIDASFLPSAPPNDPADRIIIATARALDLTVVTRDRSILDYAEHGHVRALPC